MIRKTSILLVALLIQGLAFAQLEFKGELDPSHQVTEVYLYKYVGMKAYPFDTIPVKKNIFRKVYSTFDKGLYLLGIGEVREDIVLVENKVEINIPSQINDLPWKQNSLANADYHKIRLHIQKYDQVLQGLDAEYKAFEYLAQVNPDEFNFRLNKLRGTLDSINKVNDNFYQGLAKNGQSDYGKNLGSFMAITPTTTKGNYFNTAQFKNTQLASGDFILRKVNYSFMRFGGLNESNLAVESQTLLSYCTEKNICKELMFEAIINNVIQVSEAQTRAVFMQYESEFGSETLIGQRLKNIVPAAAPAIGQKAPDIVGINKDGEVFKLSDLKGQVVLIDFWASWCGPCRHESPNVVANYNKYKDKGFTILSISADKDKNSWLKAIEQDHYTWKNHLLSQENNYKAQRDYQVQGYPTMFLVDSDGTLISFGNGLRGPGLSSTLASVFAKK